MRLPASAVLLICLMTPASARAGAPASGPESPRGLLISLDGFEARYLNDKALRLPHLRALARRGVHGASRTVLPSVTWPAHTTVITGTLPRRHGVVGNHWLDRTTRKVVHAWQPSKEDSIDSPTIFDVAKEAGRTTAAVSWPQTNGAKSLDFEIPEVYSEAAFQRWVTRALRQELTEAGLPVDTLNELAKAEEIPLDRLVADVAEHLLVRHDPGLTLVHFTSGDTRAHRAGILSPRHRAGLEAYDDLVGQLLQAVASTGRTGGTVVMVVSDHGFHTIDAAIDPAKLLEGAGLAAKDVTFVHNGHVSYAYVRGGPGRSKRTAALRAALLAHPAIERVHGATEFHGLGLPTPSENPAIGDLVLVSTLNHAFRELPGKALVGPYPYKATHGFDPDHPANRPVFIAAGPGLLRERRATTIRNVDVAPTLAHLLGLTMPSAVDGRVLTELMTP